MNKMAVHLYMLCPLMKDRIVGYVNSSLVITIHRHWTIHIESEFPQQGFHPHHLTCGISHRSILCFITETRYNTVLLTPPTYQITFNISASRFSISFILCIVRTWKNFNLQMSMIFIQSSVTWRFLDVCQNSQDSLPMISIRLCINWLTSRQYSIL